MKYLFASSAMLLVSLSAASAQSGPDFQFSGEFRLEANMQKGSTPSTYANLSFNADFVFTTLASGTKFGFDLDYMRIVGDNVAFDLIFGGVYADFGNHRVTVGVPKGSFGTFGGSSILENASVYEVTFSAPALGPISSYFQLGLDKYAMGVRYDGDFGNFSVSGSYAQSEIFGTVGSFTDVSVQYRFSEMVAVWASAEWVEKVGPSDTRYAVGVTGSYGQVDYSATYVKNTFLPNVVDVDLIYHMNDNLEIGVGGVWIDGSDTLYGVSAKYSMGDRFFVEGTVLKDSTPNPFAVLSIGMEF